MWANLHILGQPDTFLALVQKLLFEVDEAGGRRRVLGYEISTAGGRRDPSTVCRNLSSDNITSP